MWACPHCNLALIASADDAVLACGEGHTFDRAREGYVNLLPSNRKRTPNPGDAPLMVAARRRVHAANVYRPLADALVRELQGLSLAGPVLDLGCGEGYYAHALNGALPACPLYGIDISRAAVRLAAKGCPQADFAVASAYRLPLPDASFDAVVRIFAPCDDGEVIRVLARERFYLEVSPAGRHLWEVRERLYDTPRAHAPARADIAGMRLLSSHLVEYQQALDSSLLADVIDMTPFAYRGHREKRDHLRTLALPVVTMAFSAHLFQRVP